MYYVAAAVLDAVSAHAAAEYPNEACGLLIGSMDEAGSCFIRRAEAAKNLAVNPSSAFILDPALQFRLQRELRATVSNLQESVLGCYHSHPDGRPNPSSADHAGAASAAYPLWLIMASGESGAIGRDNAKLFRFSRSLRELVPVAFTL